MAKKKANEMAVESVPIDDLELDPKNARVGSVPAIVDSLKEFGQHRPIVAVRKTKRIVAGNHLWKAAKALGWETVNVYWVDDDDRTAVRRSIADNATGDLATWQTEQLKTMLEEVGEDPVPGIEPDYVSKLLAGADENEKTIFKSLEPRKPAEMAWALISIPISKFGEIAELLERAAEIEGATVETTVTDG